MARLFDNRVTKIVCKNMQCDIYIHIQTVFIFTCQRYFRKEKEKKKKHVGFVEKDLKILHVCVKSKSN